MPSYKTVGPLGRIITVDEAQAATATTHLRRGPMGVEIWPGAPASTPLALRGGIFIPAGSAVAQAAASAVLQGTLNAQRILVSWAAPGAGGGMLLYRRMASDEAFVPGNPYNWERLTPVPLTGTTYLDNDLWEGEEYRYRLVPVTAGGVRGAVQELPPITVGPQAMTGILNHWSEDVSKTRDNGGGQGRVWRLPAGVTVSAVTGGQAVAFSGVGLRLDQAVPTYDLNGRTYTLAALVRGTSGQTISLGLNNIDANQTGEMLVTLGSGTAATGADAGWEWFVVSRFMTAAGRNLALALGTALNATARGVQVRRLFVAEGNLGLGEMQALHAAKGPSTGPGSIWQQPIQTKPWDLVSGAAAFSSWHRSDDYDTPAVALGYDYSAPSVFERGRVISFGSLFYAYGGSRTIIRNNRGIAYPAKRQDSMPGAAYFGDFQYRLEIDGNDFRNTRGISSQYFWGRGLSTAPDDTLRVRRNRMREQRGQRQDANGQPVRSSWPVGKTNKPAGRPYGYELTHALICNQLDYVAPQAQAGDYIYGAEVAYNEIVGRPGLSRSEDILHFNMSSHPTSPLRVHDNLGWATWSHDYVALDKLIAGQANVTWEYGAYEADNPDHIYSGSGFMPTDFVLFNYTAGQQERNSQNVLLERNVVIGLGSFLATFDGRGIHYRDSEVYCSGYMPDGLARGVRNGGDNIDTGHGVTKYINSGTGATWMRSNSIRGTRAYERVSQLTYLNGQLDALMSDNRAESYDNQFFGRCTPEDEYRALGRFRDRVAGYGVTIGTDW